MYYVKNLTFLKYAVASGGDSAMYSYVNSFWLFYMTTVAGVPPAAAGFITAIATACYAFSSPLIASLSDRSRHRLGRRRPFLIFSALPLGFVMCLMFTPLPMSGPFEIAILAILGIAHFVLFSAFFIPHLAWGAEIATDYHERTTIRTFSFIMYTTGALLGNAAPTAAVDWFGAKGMSEASSWLITSIIIGVISVGGIMFTGLSIRERPMDETAKPLGRFSLKALLLDYMQALKLRPLRLLVCAVAVFIIANILITVDRMYVFTFILGYSGVTISIIMLVAIASSIALAVPVMKLAQRFGKRTMLIACFAASGCMILSLRFIGIHGMSSVALFICAYMIASTAYWQLMPATFYDLCEVDEYENHVKRAGTITSILPITQALSSAVGIQLLGIWLQFRGFVSGAASQSESALTAILDCFTTVPGAMLALATVAMILFPITKQKFEAIQRALREEQGP
jgi:GPH family glycoside/pentoside/hexuronide:cation symporter